MKFVLDVKMFHPLKEAAVNIRAIQRAVAGRVH